jgi:hypothetical protein
MREDALGEAVAVGLLVLAENGVAGLARLDRGVLRYDPDAPEDAVAAAITRELARASNPNPPAA